MKPADGAKKPNSDLIFLLALLIAGTVLFHLANALKGQGFYRDQHLGAALHFAKTRIDLAHAIIVGFNATDTPTIQEFPFWQGAVGLAFKALGLWWGWANVISLLLFFSCLYPLWRLFTTELGERAGLWSLVSFLSQPLVFVHAGQASTDGFSLAAAIWFWYCAIELLRSGSSKWWLAAVLFGTVAALSKLPFFMSAGVSTLVILVKDHAAGLRRWFLLGSVGAVTTVLFLGWTKYTDQAQAAAVFPLADLRLSNPGGFYWYFGDWNYRFAAENWLRAGWRFLNGTCGSFVVAGLVLYSLFRRSGNFVGHSLLIGGVTTTLVFTHLVLHHHHYFLMFSPAIAALCGEAVANLESRLAAFRDSRSFGRIALYAILICLSLTQGLFGMHIVLNYDRYPRAIAEIIRKNTRETDKLLIQGGGWGGEELILSDRHGLSIWDTHLLEDSETYARLKSLGFTTLVMISESPLHYAVRQTTPGAGSPREIYQQHMTAIAKDWPSIFQSEDIVIKSIP